MGQVIRLAGRGPAELADDRQTGVNGHTEDCSLTDLMSQWTHLIASSVAERIYDLGGSDDDVRQVAEVAALAMFSWSAGDGIRS